MKQGILFLRRMGYPAQKMMKKTEYKKGYEAGYHNGAKDCQKLYSKILDYICSMFQEKKEDKEKECKGQIDGCKEKQKMIEKIISGRPVRPMILNKPIDGSLKVGDIVFTKSHVVLDVGFVKSTFPLRIYSRSTKYDFGGVPGEVELTFGRANYYKLYYSGVNMSLDKWKEISLDASAEEVCKKNWDFVSKGVRKRADRLFSFARKNKTFRKCYILFKIRHIIFAA